MLLIRGHNIRIHFLTWISFSTIPFTFQQWVYPVSFLLPLANPLLPFVSPFFSFLRCCWVCAKGISSQAIWHVLLDGPWGGMEQTFCNKLVALDLSPQKISFTHLAGKKKMAVKSHRQRGFTVKAGTFGECLLSSSFFSSGRCNKIK